MKRTFSTIILTFFAFFFLTGALFPNDVAQLGTPKNYVSNGGIERGTAGFATYKNTAQATPVNGTGGSPTHITIAKNTSTPLKDSTSLNIVNSGSTSAQGEGVSYDFTIDSSDQAQVMQLSMDYKLQSGTFVSGSYVSGTITDSDLEVYLYDKTNAVVIQPSGYVLTCGAATTTTCAMTAQFQSASNSTSYRAIWHVPTTHTSAWTMAIDNITVSRVVKLFGNAGSDFVDSGPIVIRSSSQYIFTITSASVSIGWQYTNNGATFTATNALAPGTALDTYGTGAPSASGTLTCVLASGCSANLTFSSVTTSSPTKGTVTFDHLWTHRVGGDLEGRVEFAQSAGSGAGNGDYLLELPYQIDTTKVTPYTVIGSTLRPGQGVGYIWITTTNGPTWYVGEAVVYDSYHIRVFLDSIGTTSPDQGIWGSGTAALNQVVTYAINFKVPIQGWSSTVQMSDQEDGRQLYFKATNTSGSSINNSGDQTVPFPTTIFDSHGGWDGTSTYTVPIAGRYKVSGVVNFSSQSYTAGNHLVASVYQNGSAVSYGTDNTVQTTTTSAFPASVSTELNCNAGDTIQLKVLNNRTGGASTLSTTAGYNHIEIERLSGLAAIGTTESVTGRYYASSTSISGSLATVTMSTKDWDSHGIYSAGILKWPISGKYLVTFCVATTGTIALNSILDLQMQRAGSSSLISESKIYAGGAQTDLVGCVTDTVQALAGDTLTTQVSSSATGPSIVSSNSQNYVSWQRVGN